MCFTAQFRSHLLKPSYVFIRQTSHCIFPSPLWVTGKLLELKNSITVPNLNSFILILDAIVFKLKKQVSYLNSATLLLEMFSENTGERLFAIGSPLNYRCLLACPQGWHYLGKFTSSVTTESSGLNQKCQVKSPSEKYYSKGQHSPDLWPANSGKPDYN